LGSPLLWVDQRSRLLALLKTGWKISNWKTSFLSQAGKEILLKAVVQAIPTYCMGVFQLSISLCKVINSMMQNFW